VGQVYLGIDQAGVRGVLRAMLWLMAGLGLLAVLAIVGLSQYFGLLILRPVRLLRRTLNEFGAGAFERRISETRRDEIGEIYSAFNRMADNVQARLAISGEDGAAHPSVPPNFSDHENRLDVTIRAKSA
jgi:HAMP domain-containing protein